MKHYEKLLELGCFSKNDLEQITGSEAAAKWLCREYQKKGYIERVKRDLYVAISLENQQPIANRYVIASHISNDAAVSYHSAFEFYGYSNQVFYETQVTSESRFRDFEYDGVTYRRIAPRITGGITEINGTRVTTLERTVIDSVNLFEKIGGLEELLRCLALIPTLDEALILPDTYTCRCSLCASYLLTSFSSFFISVLVFFSVMNLEDWMESTRSFNSGSSNGRLTTR